MAAVIWTADGDVGDEFKTWLFRTETVTQITPTSGFLLF